MIRDDAHGKIHTDGSRSGGQPLDDSIEAKALALVNEMRAEKGGVPYYELQYVSAYHTHEALCRAIEQHEAFKQKVSDIVYAHVHVTRTDDWEKLKTLIIPKPKPDPLFGVLWDLGMAEDRAGIEFMANGINDALKARGLEIRGKGQ